MFFSDPHIVERNVRLSVMVGWLGEVISSFTRFGDLSLVVPVLIGRYWSEEVAKDMRGM